MGLGLFKDEIALVGFACYDKGTLKLNPYIMRNNGKPTLLVHSLF